jgi:acyl carrier protein
VRASLLRQVTSYSIEGIVLLLIVGSVRAGTAGGGIVQDALQVLVHEGGPSFTNTPPELLRVAVIQSEGPVMSGRLLEATRSLRTFAVGDTIEFVRVTGYSHPVLVTDRYVMERKHCYVIGCQDCGFSELFDCPSDLAARLHPGRSVSTLVARCPICGGGQVVRILPATPATPRDATVEQVIAAVQSIIAAQLGKTGSTFPVDQRLRDLGADELDHVEIVFALEEHFVVSIPDERLGDVFAITMQELINTVLAVIAESRDDEMLRVSE